MSAKALLDEVPAPTVMQIRDALGGNLCRCTGYAKMIEAIQAVANGSIEPVASKSAVRLADTERTEPWKRKP